MKIEVTDHNPVKKEMEIEVEADVVAEEVEKVLRSFARKAKIPGFRPGKAPLSVIRTRFASEVREEVRDRLVQRSFHDASHEKGLKPLGDPILEEVSLEDELRDSQAKLIADEGREATTGDVLITDVKGTPAEGEPFERERMFLEVGATDNLPAFNENLLGVKAGEEREFTVEYPKEYATEQLAGQAVRYQLQVHEVKRRETPELDDEFAKDLGEFDSLDDLRNRVREDLVARTGAEVERGVRQAVLDKVLLENPVVLPDTLVEGEIRYRLEELVRRLMMQGMDPEKVQLDWKELRTQQEEPARKAVHARLVLDEVARSESVEVTDEEVDQRLRRDAEALGHKYEKFRADLMKQGGVEVLKNQLVREKSLDLLTSVANIQNEE
jgi:trigger factor